MPTVETGRIQAFDLAAMYAAPDFPSINSPSGLLVPSGAIRLHWIRQSLSWMRLWGMSWAYCYRDLAVAWFCLWSAGARMRGQLWIRHLHKTGGGFLKKLFADGGYQGSIFGHARKKILPHLEIEIVKRSDVAMGFEVIPRRWVVERTFAWLGRCRRLAKDSEHRTRTARAFLILASIRLMMRKLCLRT